MAYYNALARNLVWPGTEEGGFLGAGHPRGQDSCGGNRGECPRGKRSL